MLKHLLGILLPGQLDITGPDLLDYFNTRRTCLLLFNLRSHVGRTSVQPTNKNAVIYLHDFAKSENFATVLEQDIDSTF